MATFANMKDGTPLLQVAGGNPDRIVAHSIATTDWVSNSGSDATEFPYVCNITTSLYSDSFIPSEVLLLGADITDYLSSSEETALSLIDQYIKFTSSAIRLRATDAPGTALTLVVRG